MPQLDLTSYNSQLFWSVLLFLYLYLYVHTNVLTIIIQILKTRNIKRKMDINHLNKNNLYLNKEINQLQINFSLIFKLLRFINFSNLVLINIFYKILKKNQSSSNVFFKSIFNYLIIK